jgi:uncharacterized delta-60 repeat protein
MGSDEFVNSGLLLPDGKYLLVGKNDSDLVVSRHLQAGAIDPTSGSNCSIKVPVLNGADEGYRATLAADGKILITGFANNGSNQDLVIVRMSYDGVLDTSVGFEGKFFTNFAGANDYGCAIASLPDGKILVAGEGDADNASFTIVGNELRTAAEFATGSIQ